MTEQANSDWYRRLSEKRALPLRCPIAAIDKCPRYFLSLQHAAKADALSVEVAPEVMDELKRKWANSEPFVLEDNTVASYFGRASHLNGVGGFCPEVTAHIFGEYCSELREFPDSDASRAYNAELNDEKAKPDDPRRNWLVCSPRHFSDCSEFSIYSNLFVSSRARAKSRKGVAPRLRFQILARDGYRCVYCGATGDTAALHVDHKTSIAEGGTDEPENLVTACERCNLGKGAKSAA